MSAAEVQHAQRVLSLLNQQRAAGRFCDAVLHVGGGAVSVAHRCILACFSELFQEAPPPAAPCTEFSLQGCTSAGLELLLRFVYTGELTLDADNLEQVQHAASSLGVHEALAICQRFKEASPGDAAPPKRKRGRPRKSAAGTNAVKQEDGPPPTADRSSDVGLAAAAVATPSGATTTTRSGRVVKGPKRLLTIDESPLIDAKTLPADTESGGAIQRADSDQPAAPTEETKQQLPVRDGEEEAEGAAADEDEDVAGFEDVTDDTDEDYVPEAESSPPSASTSQKCKGESGRSKDGDVSEEDGGGGGKHSVQCSTCMKSFKSKYYLKVHNRRHTGERPFGCQKCGKRYFRKENLLIHEIRDCARLQSFTCPTCSAVFKAREDLRVHVVSHTGELPHKCSTCPEQFMYKKTLTVHMMKVHGFPKPHACPQCTKTFLTRTELRVHEAAKHRGEKPFVCEECGHRASSRNGLQMHIKAIHRNERPFVCTLCGHAFSQKNNLNMHLRIHSGERPYQCHLCGKTFRTQASLDKHHRTHTGERPFACDVCEQRFTEKGALMRHKASKHEEGRPHCCQICCKTFKAKEQLRVHLRRHKGVRKFECLDCGYKFTRQAHLRRHVQIHKRTENYNPRQRKLRNVIVQEVDDSPAEVDAAPADFDQPQAAAQEAPASGAGCIVRVVIESGEAVMEQDPGRVEEVAAAAASAAGFPVLQRVQLIAETYETSTIDLEGMAGNASDSKT